MSRKPTKNTRETPAPMTAGDDALELAMSQLDEGTVVRIYRYREDGTRAFILQLPPQDGLEQQIAQKCGPGKYHLVFYGPRTQDRAGGYRGSFTVHVDPPAQPLTPDAGAPATPPPDRISALLEGATVSVFESMIKASEMNAKILERAMGPRSSTLDRVLDVALPLALPKLLEYFLDRKRGDAGGVTRAELAELLAKSPKSGSLAEVKDTLAIMRELRELDPAPDAGAGAEPITGANDPAWMRLLERVAVSVGERLMTPRAGGDPPVRALPPATGAGGEPEVIPGEESLVMPADLSILQGLLPQLIQWASEQRPAAWVATTLRFEVDPQYHPRIVAALRQSDVPTKLATFIPALRPYTAWMEEVRQEVLRTLGAAEVPAGGAAPGAGADSGGGNGGGGGRSRQARGGKREP